MAQVFEFHLKDGKVLDLTDEELLKRGYTPEDVMEQKFLYNEEDEKLSDKDINNLLDHL